MPASQCLGRLVRDGPKGVYMLEFEKGEGLFHIPIRCDMIAKNGDLCEACQKRSIKTQDRVGQITGTTIGGPLPSYLMGRVTEPIPFWSRLYGGVWYNLKIESGSTLSEETMAKAKKAAATAYEGVETVDPQPMPAKARKPRAKKGTAAAPAVPTAPAVAAVPAPAVPTPAVPTPAPVPVPPKAVKKRQPKMVSSTPVAIIPNPTEVLPVDSIREIRVKKQEVDGRTLYVGPKDKVYDLKFKYLGRLKEDKIVNFPDSDEGI
jgi:hypothetical protein